MINISKLFIFVIFTVIVPFSLVGCGDGGSNGGSNDVENEPDAFITIDFGGGVNMTMNWIKSGNFLMGDPPGGEMSFSQPQHDVTLTKGFYMGIHQVTQEQWTAVMTGSVNNINPSYFTDNAESGEIQLKRPVELVTWFDTIEFCNLLSAKAGFENVYMITDTSRNTAGQITDAKVSANWDKNGFRLPTGAEWEYACRAGTATQWSFGDTAADIGDYAWYENNSDNKTHQVGKKTANAWGLYDMHGNLWEWCWDWYDDYTSDAKTDPRGPDDPNEYYYGFYREFRGGSWNNSARDSRSAYRSFNYLDYRSVAMGFRVVRFQ